MVPVRRRAWLLWAAVLALLAVDAIALATLLPARDQPWFEAEASVVELVLGLLALVAGVATFALRETLVMRDLRSGSLDPTTPLGALRIQQALAALWGLSLVIAGLGNVLAWGSARPIAAIPFLLGAAVLLFVHAPRAWLYTRPAG